MSPQFSKLLFIYFLLIPLQLFSYSDSLDYEEDEMDYPVPTKSEIQYQGRIRLPDTLQFPAAVIGSKLHNAKIVRRYFGGEFSHIPCWIDTVYYIDNKIRREVTYNSESDIIHLTDYKYKGDTTFMTLYYLYYGRKDILAWTKGEIWRYSNHQKLENNTWDCWAEVTEIKEPGNFETIHSERRFNGNLRIQRIERIYDDEGKIIKEFAYTIDSEDEVPRWRVKENTNKYYKKKKTVRREDISEYKPGEYIEHKNQLFKYDEKDRMIVKFSFDTKNDTLQYKRKQVWGYNKNDEMNVESSYKYKNGEWILKNANCFHHDDKGRLIELEKYNSSNGENYHIFLNYDENGIDRMICSWVDIYLNRLTDNDFTFIDTLTFHPRYDQAGNLVSCRTEVRGDIDYKWNESWEYDSLHRLTYYKRHDMPKENENGNIPWRNHFFSTKFYLSNDRDESLQYSGLTEMEIIWDDPTTAIADSPEIILWKVSHNPETDTLKIMYSLPEDANIEFEILDKQKKPLHRQSLGLMTEGVNFLSHDCRALKRGIYFFRLKSNGHSAFGKFIINK
jgi:hypothetical protein